MQFSLIQSHLIQPNPAESSPDQFNPTQCNRIQPKSTQSNPVQFNLGTGYMKHLTMI